MMSETVIITIWFAVALIFIGAAILIYDLISTRIKTKRYEYAVRERACYICKKKGTRACPLPPGCVLKNGKPHFEEVSFRAALEKELLK